MIYSVAARFTGSALCCSVLQERLSYAEVLTLTYRHKQIGSRLVKLTFNDLADL